MGAWSTEPFGNDDAMDWVSQLPVMSIDDRLVAMKSALTAVTTLDPEQYIELPEANVAIAVAAVIATQDTSYDIGPDLDEDELAAIRDLPPLAALIPAARVALSRVLARSEWRDLWEEDDSLETALDELAPVLDALNMSAPE